MMLALGAVLGCGDALTSRVDVAAHVGSHELGVDRLAEVLASGKSLPLRRDVAEGIAVIWVDYTIFADRLLEGDSLTDSTYVDAAMWAEIQQELADRYHEHLVRDRVQLDSAQVDSAYAAGQYRLIRHVLFGVAPTASPDVRNAKRRLAEDTHAKLARGTMAWSGAVALSEDPTSRDRNGSLGVIAHGETNVALENVAYALAPGELSGVTETSAGFHILVRPTLHEAHAEFQEGLDIRREQEFDETYLAELPTRWDVSVRDGIAPAVRQLGQDPMRAKESGKVLGTYRGGRFRVSDLARWLQAMPIQVRQQLSQASDSQITQMVSNLMNNEVLLREAREAGVEVTSGFRDEMAEQLRRELALTGALIGFPSDSLAVFRALPEEERRALVEVRVLAYLDAVAQARKRWQAVPPFLADALRDEAKWRVVPAGIERVLARARAIRLALEEQQQQEQPAQPPLPPVTPPGADTSAS
jgi:hypothetical protein